MMLKVYNMQFNNIVYKAFLKSILVIEFDNGTVKARNITFDIIQTASEYFRLGIGSQKYFGRFHIIILPCTLSLYEMIQMKCATNNCLSH